MISDSSAPPAGNPSGRHAQGFHPELPVLQAAPNCRILVVDDDLDYLHSLAALLRDKGHEVWFAINGYAALEAASHFHPQLVLLDMGLPDMDGCEVARRLKRLAAFVAPIVAVTARSSEADRQRSFAAGCVGHLVKPVDPKVMEKIAAYAASD